MEETVTDVDSQLLQTTEKVLIMKTGDQVAPETGQQCMIQTGHQSVHQAAQQTTTQTGQQFVTLITETAHHTTAEVAHQLTPMAEHQLTTETEHLTTETSQHLTTETSQHLTTETSQQFTTETSQQFITETSQQFTTDTEQQLITEAGHQPMETSSEPSNHTSDIHTLQADQNHSQQTPEGTPGALSTQFPQPQVGNGSSCASSGDLPSVNSLSLPVVSVTDSDFVVNSSTTPEYDLAQSQLIEVNSSDMEALVKCEVMDVEEEKIVLMPCEGVEREGGEGTSDGSGILISSEEGAERQSDQEAVQGLVKHEVEDESARDGTTDGSKTSSSSSASSRWSHADTLRLIQLYKENRHHFADKHYKKKTVWVMLAAKLARGSKSKMKFTSTQVYNRWKNLTKTYRDCLDDIRHAGSWVGKCRFFDDMASVYDANSVVYPKRKTPRKIRKRRGCKELGPTKQSPTAANLRAIAPKGLTPVTILPCSCSIHCAQSPVAGLEGEAGGSGGGFGEVVRAVQKLHEDQKVVDAWKLEKLEQMHKEKMNMFSQFLDILKTLKK